MIIIEYREGRVKEGGDRKTINGEIWNEQVRIELKKRNLMVVNDKTETPIITNNKTIMKLTEEFIKDKAEKLRTYN